MSDAHVQTVYGYNYNTIMLLQQLQGEMTLPNRLYCDTAKSFLFALAYLMRLGVCALTFIRVKKLSALGITFGPQNVLPLILIKFIFY